MRPSVSRAPAPFLVLAVTLLAAVLAQPAAAATLLGISFDPPSATWLDDVVAHLTIRSDCIVSAESQVHLTSDSNGPALLIEPDYGCVYDPPLVQTWKTVAHVGHLPPGTYTVRVVGVTPEPQGTYESYRPSSFELTVPEPVTDAAAFELDVTGYGFREPETTSVDVEPPFVNVYLDSQGPIPAFPEAMLFHHPVEIGPLQAGDWQLRVFNEELVDTYTLADRPLRVYAADGCVPSAADLCLNDARFRVEATFMGFGGGSGDGQAIPLDDRDDTGLFWFFNPNNVELTVKVLDGCGVNGRYWVFLSAGSTVDWQVRVTDTSTGASVDYDNALGETPDLIADTAAFQTCP